MKENIVKQENMSGKEKLNTYLSLLEKNSDEFNEVKAKYVRAVNELKKVHTNTDELCSLNNQLIVIELEVMFKAGLNQVFDNCKNLDLLNFEGINYDYLFDKLNFRNQPDYILNRAEYSRLISNSSIMTDELYDTILEYQAFLETYIPKIAHYFGTVIGYYNITNSSMCVNVETKVCDEYKKWLSDYLNCALD